MKADGHWLLVEPFANDNLTDNLNPLGRLFYSVSTLVCTPASLSQEVGAALGAQAGESGLREVAQEARFSTFHRATETPSTSCSKDAPEPTARQPGLARRVHSPREDALAAIGETITIRRQLATARPRRLPA